MGILPHAGEAPVLWQCGRQSWDPMFSKSKGFKEIHHIKIKNQKRNIWGSSSNWHRFLDDAEKELLFLYFLSVYWTNRSRKRGVQWRATQMQTQPRCPCHKVSFSCLFWLDLLKATQSSFGKYITWTGWQVSLGLRKMQRWFLVKQTRSNSSSWEIDKISLFPFSFAEKGFINILILVSC